MRIYIRLKDKKLNFSKLKSVSLKAKKIESKVELNLRND